MASEIRKAIEADGEDTVHGADGSRTHYRAHHPQGGLILCH